MIKKVEDIDEKPVDENHVAEKDVDEKYVG